MRNIIYFRYICPDKIDIFREILKKMKSANCNSMKKVCGNYVLTCHEDYQSSHDCIMLDMLESDIFDYDATIVKNNIVDTYYDLCQEHPDSIRLLVHSNSGVIENKILRIIQFAFTKVYKSRNIYVVFNSSHDCSIPDIIMTTLENNFKINNISITESDDIVVDIKQK